MPPQHNICATITDMEQTTVSLDHQLNELLGYHVVHTGSWYILTEPNGHEYPTWHVTEREAWHDAPTWTLGPIDDLCDLLRPYPVTIINDPASGEWYVHVGGSALHHSPRVADAIVAALVDHLHLHRNARGPI